MNPLFSTNLKSNSYNPILVIVDCPTKIIYYKFLKTIIDLASPAEVIINVVIRYYDLLKLIISDKSSLFIVKL